MLPTRLSALVSSAKNAPWHKPNKGKACYQKNETDAPYAVGVNGQRIALESDEGSKEKKDSGCRI